jgi:hypothetical protein
MMAARIEQPPTQAAPTYLESDDEDVLLSELRRPLWEIELEDNRQRLKHNLLLEDHLENSDERYDSSRGGSGSWRTAAHNSFERKVKLSAVH